MDMNVHPKLISSRFAYVSISRASHDVQIYTDDTATLAAKLGQNVTKASAIEFGKSPITSVGLDQRIGARNISAGSLGLSL